MAGHSQRLPVMNGRKAGKPGRTSWSYLLIASAAGIWMTANFSWAQAGEQKTWPQTGRGLWYWIEPKIDFTPEQVNSAFRRAIAEEMAFLDPDFSSTVFFAKDIRVTKGKARDRKRYPDRPEQADDIRFEAEWRTGYLDQFRGTSFCYIALDSIRSMDLRFRPDLRERFPKAPEGRDWNATIYNGAQYNFFFGTEDCARNFINAMGAVLRQRGMAIPFSRFGVMWENVTPAQAADMGKPAGMGVLVTMVAIAGPADQAGIRPLDVVLEFNGTKVKNFSHFSLLLDGLAPGAKASLLLLRRLKDPILFPGQNTWDTLTLEMAARL